MVLKRATPLLHLTPPLRHHVPPPRPPPPVHARVAPKARPPPPVHARAAPKEDEPPQPPLAPADDFTMAETIDMQDVSILSFEFATIIADFATIMFHQDGFPFLCSIFELAT